MTSGARTFMAARSQDNSQKERLARAISDALTDRYQHHTAKHVARDLDCTPKAATNLLRGHLSIASAAKLISAYGAGWLAERVLEAAGQTLESYIDQQAEAAEAAAAKAREHAEEARRRHANFSAARRGNPGDDGPRA